MISIIVVTYNRKVFLKKCLESLLSQDFPEDYEVVVIDNGSTDGTGKYLEEVFRERIKYVVNTCVKGLAFCKEQGVQLALWNVVAFTDDDCVVSRQWLKNIRKFIKEYDVVGGRVFPSKNVKFPWWWRKSMEWLAGINSNPGHSFLPLGSNVAFRRKAFKPLKAVPQGQFSSKGCNPYGEDNARVSAALCDGFRLGINRDMVVYHQILSDRLKITALIKRSYMEGQGWAERVPDFETFLFRMGVIGIAPFRTLATFDLNYFFRMVLSFGYVVTFLRRKA